MYSALCLRGDNMTAYPDAYLYDVVETQGKLFDLVARIHPDKDTKAFINSYMRSKTRKAIDEAKASVATMDAEDLLGYFISTENYEYKPGESMKGFVTDWIGEFYAYYQWYYSIPSDTIIDKVPINYLIKAYPGLHDLELELAVQKVGIVN